MRRFLKQTLNLKCDSSEILNLFLSILYNY